MYDSTSLKINVIFEKIQQSSNYTPPHTYIYWLIVVFKIIKKII